MRRVRGSVLFLKALIWHYIKLSDKLFFMDNLQKIVVLCIVGIIIVIAGFFLFFNNNSEFPSAGTVVENSERDERSDSFGSEDFNESGIGSLKNLLARGENITCTFTHASSEEGSYSGVVYVAGDDMRGDFEMEIEGESFGTHIINSGGTGYTWGDSSFGSMAMMFEIDEEDGDFFSSDASDSDGGVDYDQDVDYKCSSWRVDRSKFQPPSDVTFQDFSARLNAIPSAPTSNAASFEAPQLDCSLCDQVPAGEARTQCLISLGCS